MRLPVTHELLAQMVGAQRPTVSPGLTRLAEQGTVCAEPDGWLIHPNLTPAPPARRPE
ncbi:MAG: helix-turn-helix domain-containing protein [Solirubrobacteraceae bacterium]